MKSSRHLVAPIVPSCASRGRCTDFPAATGQESSQQSASLLGSKDGVEGQVCGMKLCWCPKGRFVMGSPPGELVRRPDEDQVEVILTKGFWTGKYEVTQGQWKQVIGKLPDGLTASYRRKMTIPWATSTSRRQRRSALFSSNLKGDGNCSGCAT